MNGKRLQKFAVVTVTYNSAKTIGPFLESFRKFHGYTTEVIVVDNCSSDSSITKTIVNQWGATFVPALSNLGYGAAINLGAQQLDPKVETILICNPDLTFLNDALVILHQELVGDCRLGLVGPQILDENAEIYPSARAFPSLRIGIGHALFSKLWKSNPWTRQYYSDTLNYSENSLVGWLSGACFAIRAEAFEQLAGFDSSYFMYFEDVDLCSRASKLGWLRKYVPAAKVAHIGSHSTSGNSNRMLKEHHKSAYIFLSKKYSAWYLWPLRQVLRIGLFFRSSVAMKNNH